MSRTLLVLMVLAQAGMVWADPVDDLRACQAQIQTLTIQARDAQQARAAYVAKLAEMLAETREQLDQERDKIRALVQELQRLKAPKPEEKK